MEELPFSVVRVSLTQARALVIVTGALDISTAPALQAALEVEGASYVLVDVRAVNVLGLAGIEVLAAAARRRAAHGGRLLLSGARPLAARCMHLVGQRHLLQPGT